MRDEPESGVAARLVVFSDDWGRHPSSSQHLIRHLLPRYRVDWVNTVGTHRPRLSRTDLMRGVEKLKGWRRPAEAVPTMPGPNIHAPIHWPGFKTVPERALNRLLLGRALAPILKSQPKPASVITTVPITADLAQMTPELNWVYYCVDDFSEWPGLDGGTLRMLERELLRHVRTVICASEVLCYRIAAFGIDAHLLTHGIDLEHWSGVMRHSFPPSPPQGEGRGEGEALKNGKVEAMREYPPHPNPLPRGARGLCCGSRPVALYWGHADRRLDAEICLAVAEVCDLRMVGRHEDVDQRLVRHPFITWDGPVPYAQLPKLAGEADVLVMPYADLPVTKAMQPLKLKEYLATGLPVIATPLPANLSWADAMDVTADPREFAALCLKRAGSALPGDQAEARRRLSAESWADKVLQFEQWIIAP